MMPGRRTVTRTPSSLLSSEASAARPRMRFSATSAMPPAPEIMAILVRSRPHARCQTPAARIRRCTYPVESTCSRLPYEIETSRKMFRRISRSFRILTDGREKIAYPPRLIDMSTEIDSTLVRLTPWPDSGHVECTPSGSDAIVIPASPSPANHPPSTFGHCRIVTGERRSRVTPCSPILERCNMCSSRRSQSTPVLPLRGWSMGCRGSLSGVGGAGGGAKLCCCLGQAEEPYQQKDQECGGQGVEWFDVQFRFDAGVVEVFCGCGSLVFFKCVPQVAAERGASLRTDQRRGSGRWVDALTTPKFHCHAVRS